MYLWLAISFIAGVFIGRMFLGKKHNVFSHKEAVEFGKKGREAQQERVQRRKERILAYAIKKGRVVNDDAEDMFCISDSTAYKYLRELTDEGKLEKHGEGRDTYYVPIKTQ
ncbi:MAG: hypothetical protein ACJKSS_01455 [Patescibacteria group bacterium UBA2103]